MSPQASVGRTVETVVVSVFALFCFLIDITNGVAERRKGFWTIAFALGCLLAILASCIWFGVCRSNGVPDGIPLTLWQGSTEFYLLAAETRLLWRMGENHCTTRLVTGFGLGLQLGLCPAGFYIHIKDISDVLWALPTITHVSILLVLYLPETKRAENWNAIGWYFGISLAAIGLLVWSSCLPQSVGQYAGHNGVLLIAIAAPFRDMLERWYGKCAGKSARSGSQMLADQPAHELRSAVEMGRSHQSDVESHSSRAHLAQSAFED